MRDFDADSSAPSGDILLRKELGARQLIKFYQGQYRDEEALLIGGEALQLWPLLADGLNDIERIKPLRHPNLLELKAFYPSDRHDTVVKDDRVFFVHRWEDGPFLSNYLREERTLEPVAALDVFMQMLAVVSYLHSQGFSHGFLSPASFLVRRRAAFSGGRDAPGSGLDVFLADYPAESIIKCELVKSGADLPYRSVLFSSPEVISRGEVRKEADYFSLGAMLFYMLTGVHPFSDSFGRPSMKDLLEGAPVPYDDYSANVPPGVRALIERLVAMDPKARLCDPDEIRGAVKILIAQQQSAPSRLPGATRRRRLGGATEKVFWVTFFTLLIAGGSIVWNIYRLLYVAPDQSRVPNLVGKDLVEATAVVGSLGLKIMQKGEDYSTAVPKGAVLSQAPRPGERLKKGAAIEVVVSRGSSTVRVPDLRWFPLEQAQKQLADAGLKVGNIQYVVDPTTTTNWVLRQQPAAGSEVHAGSVVDLEVSSGGEAVTIAMPDLSGLQGSDAEATLNARGLTLFGIDWQYGKKAESERVVAQNPAAGASVGSDVKISITVGKPISAWGKSYLNINLPANPSGGTEAKRLTVMKTERDTKSIIWDKFQRPKDNVVIDVDFNANATFQVYWGDELIRQETFQWQG